MQAKARLIPTVDGQLIADWEDDSDTQSNNSKGYSVNLNQPLYSPALRSAYNKVKFFDRQAQLAFKQSEQDLILRTVNAYIDTMIAKSSLTTTQAQERSIKQRLDRVNAEFEVGVIAITDVHEAKASYDNAKVKVIIVTEQLRSHSAPYRHLHRRY